MVAFNNKQHTTYTEIAANIADIITASNATDQFNAVINQSPFGINNDSETKLTVEIEKIAIRKERYENIIPSMKSVYRFFVHRRAGVSHCGARYGLSS